MDSVAVGKAVESRPPSGFSHPAHTAAIMFLMALVLKVAQRSKVEARSLLLFRKLP
jgi:hypothetical protein